ncbi:MAG: phosphatase PAP2 family protein, partial [Oscillospiraceae bacterium]|nr:phosphatase PAP2 family protein [Oscillospiraceae bacterium]
PVWLALSFTVCLSTMFIKQHSFLDVLGGLFLGIPLCFFIYRRKGY